MKILGIQFSDEESMENVMNELKRRGINPDNKVIPIIYGQEKVRINTIKQFSKKTAQDLIEEIIKEGL